MLTNAMIGLLLSAVLLGETYPETTPAEALTPDSIAGRYQETAAKIINGTLAGNDAYRKLERLCIDIGHRLTGSPSNVRAIEWGIEMFKGDGQENVHREKFMAPHWVRLKESVTMTAPRLEPLAALTLGGSVGTRPEGVTAQVVVVKHWDDLEWMQEEIPGKIVLYNVPMPAYDPEKGSGYGATVEYRSRGASRAAAKGAVGVLVRSVTARSLRSPHTGAMRYDDADTKIPAVAVSTEDAELIARMVARKIPVTVTMKIEAGTLEDTPSANVIGELRGSTQPDEIVVIGGHLDSWDVGQGAHDDGGGCVMAIEAINVLRKLQMIPRRTIRVVLWNNEENGLAGGKAYAKEHESELSKHIAAIESDSGTFQPTGYSVECADHDRESIAQHQLRDLVRALAPLGSMRVDTGHSGADIGPMRSASVVLMGHNVEGSRYFDYHHTAADTIDKVDPMDLSKNVAALATVAYILADMPERLGEGKPTESTPEADVSGNH